MIHTVVQLPARLLVPAPRNFIIFLSLATQRFVCSPRQGRLPEGVYPAEIGSPVDIETLHKNLFWSKYCPSKLFLMQKLKPSFNHKVVH